MMFWTGLSDFAIGLFLAGLAFRYALTYDKRPPVIDPETARARNT